MGRLDDFIVFLLIIRGVELFALATYLSNIHSHSPFKKGTTSHPPLKKGGIHKGFKLKVESQAVRYFLNQLRL